MLKPSLADDTDDAGGMLEAVASAVAGGFVEVAGFEFGFELQPVKNNGAIKIAIVMAASFIRYASLYPFMI
ncbi:hypothetical protein [Paenibacillus sp. MMO-177]|uniref:hypothetical protein n=1 Tax=Paenibacillus sp. MMO-177 TaxID=3081289 RepID=UPI00301B24EC